MKLRSAYKENKFSGDENIISAANALEDETTAVFSASENARTSVNNYHLQKTTTISENYGVHPLCQATNFLNDPRTSSGLLLLVVVV